MKQNLDTLKTEILAALQQEGFIVFHGYSRMSDSGADAVYWDTIRYPDFRDFLAVASSTGVKLIAFHHREFKSEAVESAMDQLEESEVSPEERRSLERRLRNFLPYQGFTCALELSFDYRGRTYIYDLHTEWYLDFLETTEDIQRYAPDNDSEEDGDDPIGGYFSRN
jgi:hypothetical protein